MSFCGWLVRGGSPYTGGFQRGLLSEQGLKPGGQTMVECRKFCERWGLILGCEDSFAYSRFVARIIMGKGNLRPWWGSKVPGAR